MTLDLSKIFNLDVIDVVLSNPFDVCTLKTPLGDMLAIANQSSLHLLEFLDKATLKKDLDSFIKRKKSSFSLNDNKVLTLLRQELDAYFKGDLTKFDTPIHLEGTDFQVQSWRQLLTIEYGKTCSYADQAKLIGSPSSFRAVALSNARNRLAVVVPCHRVIASNGSLSGYAGGIYRKKWLLEHESAKR